MKNIALVVAVALVAICALGCGEKAVTKEDDAKLKADFAKKEFNLKDVPEKDRAMVEGIMKANGQSKK